MEHRRKCDNPSKRESSSHDKRGVTLNNNNNNGALEFSTVFVLAFPRVLRTGEYRVSRIREIYGLGSALLGNRSRLTNRRAKPFGKGGGHNRSPSSGQMRRSMTARIREPGGLNDREDLSELRISILCPLENLSLEIEDPLKSGI